MKAIIKEMKKTLTSCFYYPQPAIGLKLRLDIQGRSQNLRHFYPGMELELGGLRVFLIIKITVVHQVHMSPASTAIKA